MISYYHMAVKIRPPSLCQHQLLQEYLSSLEHNLTGLLREMEQSGLPTESPASYWFRNISEAEERNTYLKEAAASLARVCADMEQHQVIPEATEVLNYRLY